MNVMEAKIMKISSENFCLCWMLFWTGVPPLQAALPVLVRPALAAGAHRPLPVRPQQLADQSVS